MMDKYTGRKIISPADTLDIVVPPGPQGSGVPPSWARIGKRHTFSDWLELLWITVRPVRRILIRPEALDKASLKKQDLGTLERRHHEIWFGRTAERYLRVELRRRAVRAILDLAFQCIRPWKADRWADHHASKQEE